MLHTATLLELFNFALYLEQYAGCVFESTARSRSSASSSIGVRWHAALTCESLVAWPCASTATSHGGAARDADLSSTAEILRRHACASGCASPLACLSARKMLRSSSENA